MEDDDDSDESDDDSDDESGFNRKKISWETAQTQQQSIADIIPSTTPETKGKRGRKKKTDQTAEAKRQQNQL
jgi:hypothetical protein